MDGGYSFLTSSIWSVRARNTEESHERKMGLIKSFFTRHFDRGIGRYSSVNTNKRVT